MKAEEKERAIALRKEGKTYNEILSEVPVAKSTLSLWLREVGLSTVQKQTITEKRIQAQARGAAARHTARVNSESHEMDLGIKEIGTMTNRELFLVGVALYWGEGSKQKSHSSSTSLEIVNMDVRLHRTFLAWLSLIGVAREELRADLYVHEDRAKEAESFRKWWQEELQIPVTGIYLKKGSRTTNRKNTGSLYRGLLKIKVRASSLLNRRMNGWIQGIAASVGDGVIGNTSAFGAEDSRIVP